MILSLPDDLLKEIEAHALAAYPEECCGAMIGDLPEDFGQGSAELKVSELRKFENAWESLNRTNKYAVAPEVLAGIEKEFAGKPRGILGFYHSHPDVPAVPSEYDREHAWPWYTYLIVPVARGHAGAPRAWVLKDPERIFEEEPLLEMEEE